LNNLTQNEKNIYNSFLKHFRNGLPYQNRKDFSDLTPTNVMCLKKLSYFFNKFPHINQDDFFGAPRFLHPDEKCPPLNFFITRPAIKTYSLALKKKEEDSPDKQIDKIKESFRYIGMFCLKNKIQLENYLNHKTKNMPTWMQHYREHHISPYILFEFENFEKFRNVNEEEKIMWTGNLFDNIDSYKVRYHNSQKAKQFTKEAYKKIKDFLKKELKTQIH
jgi:hypothetical protein